MAMVNFGISSTLAGGLKEVQKHFDFYVGWAVANQRSVFFLRVIRLGTALTSARKQTRSSHSTKNIRAK